MTVVPEKEDRGTCIIAGLKNKLPTHAESREFCYEYQTNQHTTCVFWKKRLHPSEAQEWTVVSSEGRISLLIAGMAEKPTGPYQIAVSWKAPRIKSKTAGHRLPSREFCQGILCWVLNQSLLKILPWLHKVLVDDSTTRCFFLPMVFNFFRWCQGIYKFYMSGHPNTVWWVRRVQNSKAILLEPRYI